LGVQLTLLQPGGADYAHHITASPPGFENPAAALVYMPTSNPDSKNSDFVQIK